MTLDAADVPLAANVRAFIDQINDGMPPVQTLTPTAARALLRRRRLSMAPQAQRAIGHVETITIPTSAGDIAARVYRNAPTDLRPIVVFFHGGGWMLCDLDTHDGICRNLAASTGFLTVSVDYPLAPEHPFPQGLHAAYESLSWVVDNGERLGGDGTRVAVVGDSSGGNLATAVAMMSRDRGGPVISAQALLYPVTDNDFTTASYLANGEGYHLTRAAMQWYWSNYLSRLADASNPYAAPLQARDLTGMPRALIITAGFDPLRDEGEAYAARLRADGTDVSTTRFNGMFHGFFAFPDAFREGAAAQAQCADFLVETLSRDGA